MYVDKPIFYNKLTILLIIFIDAITSLEYLEIISLCIVERDITYIW